MRPRVRVEEEVGRGEAVGAVWALTGGIHDTTALCVRDSELVRMSKVSSFEFVLQTCCMQDAHQVLGSMSLRTWNRKAPAFNVPCLAHMHSMDAQPDHTYVGNVVYATL